MNTWIRQFPRQSANLPGVTAVFPANFNELSMPFGSLSRDKEMTGPPSRVTANVFLAVGCRVAFRHTRRVMNRQLFWLMACRQANSAGFFFLECVM
jgi:hypothetical protein